MICWLLSLGLILELGFKALGGWRTTRKAPLCFSCWGLRAGEAGCMHMGWQVLGYRDCGDSKNKALMKVRVQL
jgi:hypothetical protein